MSECQLRVHLDRKERSYRSGERIEGFIDVVARRNLRDIRLALSREWRARGPDRTESAEDGRVVLYKGAWSAGETRSYAFRFRAPDGPMSYDGRYLDIGWHLVARVESGTRSVEEAETGFQLLPPPHDPSNPEAEPPRASGAYVWTPYGTFLTLLLGTLSGTYFGWILSPPGAAWTPRDWLIEFALWSPLGILLEIGRRLLLRWRIGVVQARVWPKVARPGDTIHCDIRFTSRVHTDVEYVTALLVGQEVSLKKDPWDHDHDKPLTHMVSGTAGTVTPLRSAAKNEPQRFEIELRVPKDAPFSVATASQDFRFEWVLTVEVEIPDWPDWSREYLITIVP